MSQAERPTAALTSRYRIERELGAGGMATVWFAHDRKHDRTVGPAPSAPRPFAQSPPTAASRPR